MIPALTIHPEWACMIDLRRTNGEGYHAFAKRVENRKWRPPDNLIGAWFAIHAGKTFGGNVSKNLQIKAIADVARDARASEFNITGEATHSAWWFRVRHPDGTDLRYTSTPNETPFVSSAIIGIAKIINVLDFNETLDIPGVAGWKRADYYGWHFDYRRLKEPVPCTGAQGLWVLPKEIQERCKQIGTVPL